MAKKKKKEPRIECIAYVSTQGSMRQTEIAERRQERYIREYAKDHSIDIVDVYYRRGMGQAVVNRHIDEIAYLIKKTELAESLSQTQCPFLHQYRMPIIR